MASSSSPSEAFDTAIEEAKKARQTDDSSVLIIAFDGEWRGNNVRTEGMLALGIAAVVSGGEQPETLLKRRWNVSGMEYYDFAAKSANEQAFEPRCEREFWDQHPEKKAAFEKDAEHWSEVAAQVRAIIDKAEMVWGPERVVLVSDSGRDFHYVDYYLENAGLLPTSQTSADKWRPRHDIDSYARGLMGYSVSDGKLGDQAVIDHFGFPLSKDTHDHWPDNDAEFIARLYWYMSEQAKRVRSRESADTRDRAMDFIAEQGYCD